MINNLRLKLFSCLPVFLTWTLYVLAIHSSLAQSTPMVAQFYQNQYQTNPAFAGIEPGLYLNLGYRNQWRIIPGSPTTSTFSSEYQYKRVGAGINIYTSKAGLISRNRVVGTYAYHLPLAEDGQKLHFGLSLGLMDERLNSEEIITDGPYDPSADLFNERKMYLDGDFGMAYTTGRLTLQGAVPNLKVFLKKDDQNNEQKSTVYLALGYKIGESLETLSIEPKVAFRGSSGIDPIWDLGANLSFLNNHLSFMGMLHNTKSSSFGFGVSFEKYNIQGFYSSQMAAQRESTGGSFELSLKIHLLENVHN